MDEKEATTVEPPPAEKVAETIDTPAESKAPETKEVAAKPYKKPTPPPRATGADQQNYYNLLGRGMMRHRHYGYRI